MELKQRIKKVLKENGELSTYKLMIKADSYKEQISPVLAEMVEEGTLKRTVVRAGTYWELK